MIHCKARSWGPLLPPVDENVLPERDTLEMYVVISEARAAAADTGAALVGRLVTGARETGRLVGGGSGDDVVLGAGVWGARVGVWVRTTPRVGGFVGTTGDSMIASGKMGATDGVSITSARGTLVGAWVEGGGTLEGAATSEEGEDGLGRIGRPSTVSLKLLVDTDGAKVVVVPPVVFVVGDGGSGVTTNDDGALMGTPGTNSPEVVVVVVAAAGVVGATADGGTIGVFESVLLVLMKLFLLLISF